MNIEIKEKKVDLSKEPLTNNPIENALNTMSKMEEIESAVEGKTIKTLSTNGFGTIIRFMDKTTLKIINGEVSYDGLVSVNYD